MLPFFPVRHNSDILIIDNSDSFTFNLVQLVREWGRAGFRVVRSTGMKPGMARSYDKILISPGPGLPSDFPQMEEVIRLCGPEREILGICLGHQAIGTVCGGRLLPLDRARHGIPARLGILVPDELLFRGVDSGTPVGLYHSWALDPGSLPESLEVTAVSEEGTVLAIRHRQWRVRGVQFHPESYLTPQGRRMIENWLEGGKP